MLTLLALATSAWGVIALPHYCTAGAWRPTQADDACRCLAVTTSTAHSTTNTAYPDWYGDVSYPDRYIPPPDVQTDSCFDVTNVTAGLGSWPMYQAELRDLLRIRAEKLAHEHHLYGGAHEHHFDWPSDNLNDASMHPGCGHGYLTFFDYTGIGNWQADLKDYQGNRILGFDSMGQGNIVGMESRNAAAWATSPVFVWLDTGAVFVLPPPHNGQGNWTP